MSLWWTPSYLWRSAQPLYIEGNPTFSFSFITELANSHINTHRKCTWMLLESFTTPTNVHTQCFNDSKCMKLYNVACVEWWVATLVKAVKQLCSDRHGCARLLLSIVTSATFQVFPGIKRHWRNTFSDKFLQNVVFPIDTGWATSISESIWELI